MDEYKPQPLLILKLYYKIHSLYYVLKILFLIPIEYNFKNTFNSSRVLPKSMLINVIHNTHVPLAYRKIYNANTAKYYPS